MKHSLMLQLASHQIKCFFKAQQENEPQDERTPLPSHQR